MVVTQEHNLNIRSLECYFIYVIFNPMESYSDVVPLHVVLDVILCPHLNKIIQYIYFKTIGLHTQ